ncbi:proline and serine-rich protein 3 [Lampris incognitus]|uniref:proline and serine-rich protein 3 n=1 Tax=Lampris incognitus TaxID=2546036 RepID=UPI0024B50EA5|nr:proline and serine-rich protein 3 [Lampris incognitus]
MKSSGAVFTKQDPFPPVPSVRKTHYHPSRIQNLSQKKRETTLSPARNKQSACPPLQIRSRSPGGRHLIGKTNHLHNNQHPTIDGQRSFSESWPSTDLESSPTNTAVSNIETFRQSVAAGKLMTPSYQEDQQVSVVAKYVERFRHGRPQSREERQQITSAVGEAQQPFWWMSSSSPSSSTPTRPTNKDDHTQVNLSSVGQCRHGSTPSPSRPSFDISSLALSDTSQDDCGDIETLQLQERASRLLQKSEYSVSSGSIPISSEGLGCSDFSSPISADEPVRRPLIPSLMEPTAAEVNLSSASLGVSHTQKSSLTPSVVLHTRPEEDILFQWRLRRKMEQARQWAPSQSQPYSSLQQSSFIWQMPNLHQVPVDGQAHKSFQPPEPSLRVTPSFMSSLHPKNKEAPGLCPSAVSPSTFLSPPISSPTVSKLQNDAHVPAHTHPLCDVLPCPIKSSLPTQHKSSQNSKGSRMKVASKKTQQVLINSADSSTEEPTSKHESSPPPTSTEEAYPAHHRGAERKHKETVQTKESEKNNKRIGLSGRKLKKSTRTRTGDSDRADGSSSPDRSSRYQSRDPKKFTSCKEPLSGKDGRHLERCQEYSCDGNSGNRAPPPSPIHSALGQVVSEVLFPTLDSSSAQGTPMSSDSPRWTTPAPPQSPVPPACTQQPLEVISQLLREAEDSDEMEFENDPLLQVLRKQRKWVKAQMSEVDSLLDELQEE